MVRQLAGLRLAVNSQTPLVRFRETDVKFTTGGVTRMLLPLLRAWLRDGTLAEAGWVALAGEEGAPRIEHEGVKLSFVPIAESEKEGYARVKETMWALLNSNPSTPTAHGEGGLPESAWEAFDAYQARSADALLDASERMGRADILYVNDFQQLGVARAWRGPPTPRVFHLHTPFPSVLPRGWADYVVAELERYDAVVVSTRRYADNLLAAGLETHLRVIAPFIDPDDQQPPTRDAVASFREQHRIAETDRVVLNVGRMDPMKGQDRLVRAMPKLLALAPDVRLVLVGNGSFSNSKRGGLGLSKGEQWRSALEALARDLGVRERVTFTGHVDETMIPAAYAASRVFCLPSTREGFGLAAIEAWRHGKPIVVSERAGVAELVEDGVNGHSLDCGDADALADKLAAILRDEDVAGRLGTAGFAASEQATLPVGRGLLEDLFASVLDAEVSETAPPAR